MPKSAIKIIDNGTGMTEDVIVRDFWGLGYSSSRQRKITNNNESVIGEKGHGTKIYLRSEFVKVYTQSEDGLTILNVIVLSPISSRKECIRQSGRRPRRLGDRSGTEIEIIGYNGNERSSIQKDSVKDYLLWFTKIGSIEKLFDHNQFNSFKVRLKCSDQDDFDEIPFGHRFPDENSNIDKLFNEKGARSRFVCKTPSMEKTKTS